MAVTSTRPGGRKPGRSLYLGVGLIAAATLMLEVLLTRLSSVIAWYHLAFFIISLALLGMTAGAVMVFVGARWFEPDVMDRRLVEFSLAFGLIGPLACTFLMSIPISKALDFMGFVSMLGIGLLLALPFLLGGVVITLVLTRLEAPVSLVYAVDLAGAAGGCVLVLLLMAVIDAPSLLLLSGALATLAAAVFARGLPTGQRWMQRLAWAATGLLAVLTFCNATATTPPLRPAWVKERHVAQRNYLYVGWNSYSRVSVFDPGSTRPFLWAKSPRAPAFDPVESRTILIDGAAGTSMVRGGLGDQSYAYLDWDLPSFVHRLRSDGGAAVVGVGGGRDVKQAVQAGHNPVVGVELNELIVDLHRQRMRDFSQLNTLPGVELYADEARSFFGREERQFEVILMSMIDTWASTGAGAYSLSENALYTVEGFETFLSRLTPTGIFSVSRYYGEWFPAETLRLTVLAMETLWRLGSPDPRRHLLLVRNRDVANLLISRSPLSPQDVALARKEARRLGFKILAAPGSRVSGAAHTRLADLWELESRSALTAWASGHPIFDLRAPTDDRPFFFNMLKPSAWFSSASRLDMLDPTGVGNLHATQTLLAAILVGLILAIATIIGPLAAGRQQLPQLGWVTTLSAMVYFALIGAGFLFVEIALLTRLQTFIARPTVTVAVLLGGIILFTGVGSLLSHRIRLNGGYFSWLYPLIAVALVSIAYVSMSPLLARFATASLGLRILASLPIVAIPGLGLGLCFPLGLRLVQAVEQSKECHAEQTLGPWLWGINGALGVVASGGALAVAMHWGVGGTVLVGTLCYLVLPLAARQLVRAARET